MSQNVSSAAVLIGALGVEMMTKMSIYSAFKIIQYETSGV